MQDMLLNAIDGCYVLLKDLDEQIQGQSNLEYNTKEDCNIVLWGEDQINWRAEKLSIYNQGLKPINARFFKVRLGRLILLISDSLQC